jgi:hypothetical protein
VLSVAKFFQIWSSWLKIPNWARHQDILTDWPSVAK